MRGCIQSRIIEVNLTKGTYTIQDIPIDVYRTWLGGGGMGAYLMATSKSYSDQILILPGMLVGSRLPTASKTSLCFISPLTGIWGESSVGGDFGWHLKRSGYDGIVIHGKSKGPVYLLITDDSVEIRPAKGIWGLSTCDARKQIQDQIQRDASIAVIGPGGENRVRFASLMFFDKGKTHHTRAAGRCGAGTLLGMKNLKAIAVSGEKPLQAVDKARLKEELRSRGKDIVKKTIGLKRFGTAGAAIFREESGDLPIKNFAGSSWSKGIKKISAQNIKDIYNPRPYFCRDCIIGCGRVLNFRGEDISGPEYETTASLGSLLLMDDPEILIEASYLCNSLGLDTMSTGVVIAFAMECCEKGILCGGDIKWGDSKAILSLIHDIAYRKGLGAHLADGVKVASEKIGQGSGAFAMHVRGLELPMHDPRAYVSAGLTYATGNRGASHNESMSWYAEQGNMILSEMGYPSPLDPHTPKGKAELVITMQDICSVYDGLGLCKFLFSADIGPPTIVKWVEIATGFKYSPEELLKVGTRIFTLKRLFNMKNFTFGTDTLPFRILNQPRTSGKAKGVLPDLKYMLEEYYNLRGWDSHGRPTRETLGNLDMDGL